MQAKGYDVIFEQEVEGLQSKAVLLKHQKSGARIFCLSNDDDNKVFYIAFRTPPENDTGIAHIMEHSVLCGSAKYPLKDPFVELAKGSLNTFLNAMTYPDKTVYPVASRNDKDFRNLMDVYLDAVFHPAIYTRPEILKQEGWHYKIDHVEDEITYNGVVYNEMKGAFSSPEGVLDREILHSLYPDTAYGVESGGDPEHIPELTYEDFLAFHKRFYHPSNSYIYLYGDMDMEEQLRFLDESYLCQYDAIEVDSELTRQTPFAEQKEIICEYPISEQEEEAGNTYLAYNMVCGDNLEANRYFAMQMILYTLVENQGAPIRDRLLKEGIGKDIMSGYENGILQPYFNIISKNADPEQKERFVEIIREELQKAVAEKLDEQSLTASLNSLEFRYKEADFGGYPKGLIGGLNLLDSWLYDESRPLLHIDCDETFRFLREQIGTDYYENLIQTYLLDNPHASILSLVPKKGLMAKKEEATKAKLRAFKDSLTNEQIEALVAECKALSEYQEAPDTPEAMASIPFLSRDDLKKETEPFLNEERTEAGFPVLYHPYFTNGIAYMSLLFDCNTIAPEDLPYLSLLKSVVSFVDTDQYNYSQLNNDINIYTGGLSMEVGVNNVWNHADEYFLLSSLSAKALYCNIEKTFDLLEEILFRGHYDDAGRLYEIVAEQKSRLQMLFNSAGHAAATSRAASYFSAPCLLKEMLTGIAFYQFIEDLEKNFEQKKEQVITKLKEVLAKMIQPAGMLCSFIGDEEGYQIFAKRLIQFREVLDASCASSAAPEVLLLPVTKRRYQYANQICPQQLNEGFKTSAGVQYVARAGWYSRDGADKIGPMRVFRTIMGYEYLWFHIRVQGGAYGCMSSANASGECSFVTYRDPHLRRSNEIFEAIPDYLETFETDELEMTKYVIGTMSAVDAPLTPAGKGARDLSAYLVGYSTADAQKIRDDIIGCSQEDIRALAPFVKRALAEGNICVIGNENKIEEDKDLLKTTLNLFS